MHGNTAHEPGPTRSELDSAEAGLSVLIEEWQRAVEELGSVLPPGQLRALLIIEKAGRLNLTGLARALGASPSATSRLCDRLAVAGLLLREPAPSSRREITLQLSESGQRLVGWVRDRRGETLARVLGSMSPDGRRDLARGLSELAQSS
jgi:DNA-binding MarR family transcriptional regulator